MGKKPHIACLMMLKNEKKRLPVTLKSLIGQVDSLVVYDTGSTDDTISILQEFSAKHNIPLRLKQGEFVNFCVSRNVSLEFADSFPDIDYILLLDCNDELRGGDILRKIATEHLTEQHNGYLVCQQWWSGQLDRYYNMRFIKARAGWRYFGSVHEYMVDTTANTPNKEPRFPVFRLPDDIVLYQDRTQDDDKTGKRFVRDKILLYNDYVKDKTEPRTLFYLAQTCSCLGEYEDALYYYKLRSEVNGFEEEKFHSYLRCGNLSQTLNQPWETTMQWYIKAAEHSDRAEPYVKIAEHYINKKRWIVAYTFLMSACRLSYPHHAILFVDKRIYDYIRWHLLGIVGYYTGIFIEGKEGCRLAIQNGSNKELDTKNMGFYDKVAEEKFGGVLPFTFPLIGLGVNNKQEIIPIKTQSTDNRTEFTVSNNLTLPTTPVTDPILLTGNNTQKIVDINQPQTNLTEKEFIDIVTKELAHTSPNLSLKARKQKARMLWKLKIKNEQKLK